MLNRLLQLLVGLRLIPVLTGNAAGKQRHLTRRTVDPRAYGECVELKGALPDYTG